MYSRVHDGVGNTANWDKHLMILGIFFSEVDTSNLPFISQENPRLHIFSW